MNKIQLFLSILYIFIIIKNTIMEHVNNTILEIFKVHFEILYILIQLFLIVFILDEEYCSA